MKNKKKERDKDIRGLRRGLVFLMVLALLAGSLVGTTTAVEAKMAKKNDSEVKALKKIIKEQRKKGAKVSQNLNSKQYSWDMGGRLYALRWEKKKLKGSLNLNAFRKLNEVHCNGNQLTSINVKKLKDLALLFCQNNQLRELNLKGNKKLYSFSCNNNKITKLDLRGISDLWSYYHDKNVKVTGQK